MEIRAAKQTDFDGIIAVATASGLLDESDLAEVKLMLQQHFDAGDASEHSWLVTDSEDEDTSGVLAVAYYAPERMTCGTANLYMLIVHPDHQRAGYGRSLIERVESDLKLSGCRILLVETLGIDEFEPQRKFYLSHGFTREATIRDFYDDQLDKVVFWKRLTPDAATDD